MPARVGLVLRTAFTDMVDGVVVFVDGSEVPLRGSDLDNPIGLYELVRHAQTLPDLGSRSKGHA